MKETNCALQERNCPSLPHCAEKAPGCWGKSREDRPSPLVILLIARPAIVTGPATPHCIPAPAPQQRCNRVVNSDTSTASPPPLHCRRFPQHNRGTRHHPRCTTSAARAAFCCCCCRWCHCTSFDPRQCHSCFLSHSDSQSPLLHCKHRPRRLPLLLLPLAPLHKF